MLKSEIIKTQDRITYLPKNVIDHILEIIPVEDAARTCILSKKWRYIWAELPNLVLDEHFCSKLAVKSHDAFHLVVDRILLHHIGDIVKFDLDVSGTNLSSGTYFDSWLLSVTRNGVKKLTLKMPKDSTYALPSCVFNCPTPTHLELFNCVFKSSNSALTFLYLTKLYLRKVNFVAATKLCVIKAPLLANMTLKYCAGTQYVKVVSSQLKYLLVRESPFNVKLKYFTSYNTLEVLSLVSCNPIHDERSTLEKLLLSLPILKLLSLCSNFLECASAGTIVNGLPFTLKCLWHLRLGVDFCKVAQVYYALEIIKVKGSPNLTKLEIWVYVTPDDVEAVLSYLDACLDRPLNKLKHVFIHFFRGSKVELLFVKLLFARAPSLARLTIEKFKNLSSDERNIMSSLMRFRRASTDSELVFLPNAV